MGVDPMYGAGVWYECTQCPFQTNSTKQRNTHEEETGHDIAAMPDHNEEDRRE